MKIEKNCIRTDKYIAVFYYLSDKSYENHHVEEYFKKLSKTYEFIEFIPITSSIKQKLRLPNTHDTHIFKNGKKIHQIKLFQLEPFLQRLKNQRRYEKFLSIFCCQRKRSEKYTISYIDKKVETKTISNTPPPLKKMNKKENMYNKEKQIQQEIDENQSDFSDSFEVITQ